MGYKVYITPEALDDLNSYIEYILEEKKNRQAAKSILDDFEETKKRLSLIAGNFKHVDNPILAKMGYKRLNFIRHKYFLLFRVENDTAIVDRVFHGLQDYARFLT